MSKQQSKEKVIVTSHDVEKDIKINETPAEEFMKENKYKVLGALIDYTHKKAADIKIEGNLDIAPDIDELAKKVDMSVDQVKECVGELHKEELIRDGEEDGTIRVDQLEVKVIRKGFTICAFCGQEMQFENETITDKWGKVDPEGHFINYRFVCLNPQCKHQAIADFRVQARRV